MQDRAFMLTNTHNSIWSRNNSVYNRSFLEGNRS